MFKRIGALLCSFGFHRLEKFVSDRGEILAETDNPYALLQQGKKMCKRKACRAIVPVYRKGFHGLAGAKWRVLSPEEEKRQSTLKHHLDIPLSHHLN